MTIKEALDKRIPRVRKTKWAGEAYLRLPLLADGKVGPWASLYSEYEQKELLKIPVGSQKLCVFMPDVAGDSGYVPYKGKPSSFEEPGYVEA